MKKIGFIDFFLNNYHANNYPKWLAEYSDGEMQVTCAYAVQDDPEGGTSNREWSERHKIPLVSSIEKVIGQCDCVMVLSPSHPETHESLSRLALTSGKRVYVDKAFAPDLETAKRMFALAETYQTPCCSSSALAFVSEYEKFDRKRIQILSSKGGGSFEVYAIHQFEPIVAIMGEKPVRVMSVGTEQFPSFIIEFEGGKIAKMEQFMNAPFEIYAGYTDGTHEVALVETDIFKNFILRVIEFFRTGRSVAERWQTMSVIALSDGAREAQKKPFQWVNISVSSTGYFVKE